MSKIDRYIGVLQLLHVMFILILVFILIIAMALTYEDFIFDVESDEFVRKVTKISIGFIIGVVCSHVIPYFLYWRRLKKDLVGKKSHLYFRGSILQWSLLDFLGLCLIVIFFIYPNLIVLGFYILLLIILLAKRPTHFRFRDKANLLHENLEKSSIK